MALLPILQYPDPRLHIVATPITKVDDGIRQLINDMRDTMYAAPGVGLAATQVGIFKRLIIVDVSESHDQLKTFINPEIIERSGIADCEEGCLSVPGIFGKVARAERITVRALNSQGASIKLQAEGLLAVCIQHEMDHLEGKVFVEYLSRLKQQRILAKFKKQQRRVM
jgi:peptide deformylase